MPPLGLYDPLSIFLQGMLSSDVTETDSAIALPRGITWPDLNSPVLFKRLCYQGLWRNVLHEGHAKDLRGAVICGSPGSEFAFEFCYVEFDRTCLHFVCSR